MQLLESPMVVIIPPQTVFSIGQLISTHLYDERVGKCVPVAGVVVVPGSPQSVIRVRDIAGNTMKLFVDNEQLSAR